MKLYLWLTIIPSSENFSLDITAVVWAEDSVAAWQLAIDDAREAARVNDVFFDPGEYNNSDECLIQCIALDDVKRGVATMSTARIGQSAGGDPVSGVHVPMAGMIVSGGTAGANPATDSTESED